MDFHSLEAQDGVRCIWNNFPSTKHVQTKSVINQAIHYTVLKEVEDLASFEQDPLRCQCSAILNPHCQVDFLVKSWTCPFCLSKNQFPQVYAQQMSEQSLPAELLEQYSTVEYVYTHAQKVPNVFLYLIDTCLEQIQINSLRDSIQHSLQLIPNDSLVGLIVYGRYVFVHELGFSDGPKSYALKGSKYYTPESIQEMLGISVQNENDPRFLVPLRDCEFTLNSILDNLEPDPWPTPQGERHQVGTGCALNIALSLLEICPYQGARIMMFIGNPCSIGPGQIVDIKLELWIRSYSDISQNNQQCKYIKTATKFYEEMASRAIKIQTVIDIYAFSADQVGLMEMNMCCEKSGGYMIMQEQFNSNVFIETFKKLFDKDENEELKIATQAKLDIFLSKELKVMGALGNCTSLKRSGPMVAIEGEVGQGGTTSWYIGGLNKSTSITFMIDISPNNKDIDINKRPFGFIQFQTIYKNGCGQTKLRITTISRKFADNSDVFDLQSGFDQEAACVMIAKMGCLKSQNQDSLQVLNWIDKTLIKLVSQFGYYNRNDLNSFKLSKEFSFYPQFMYNLRKSHFIQTFGASPDEITFYRATLNRENVQNCLYMIQPVFNVMEDPSFLILFDFICEVLYSQECYNFCQKLFQTLPRRLAVVIENKVPVLLDQSSIKNDIILLLDTYFQVLIWQGPHIRSWIMQGYLEKDEYKYLKEMVEMVNDDANIILVDRFPVPNIFITWQGHSQERYLKSRLNPSGLTDQLQESGHYITDDANLKLFMDSLIKLAVNSEIQ